MPGWNADLVTGAFKQVEDAHCDEYVDHKVIALQVSPNLRSEIEGSISLFLYTVVVFFHLECCNRQL